MFKSREDQLRLEGQLNSIRKTADESLDQCIEWFDKLSSRYKDQDPDCKADRINSYFLQALERSRIEHEKWSRFVTYLGRGWLELTERQMHTYARSYYSFHIERKVEEARKDAQVRAAKA